MPAPRWNWWPRATAPAPPPARPRPGPAATGRPAGRAYAAGTGAHRESPRLRHPVRPAAGQAAAEPERLSSAPPPRSRPACRPACSAAALTCAKVRRACAAPRPKPMRCAPVSTPADADRRARQRQRRPRLPVARPDRPARRRGGTALPALVPHRAGHRRSPCRVRRSRGALPQDPVHRFCRGRRRIGGTRATGHAGHTAGPALRAAEQAETLSGVRYRAGATALQPWLDAKHKRRLAQAALAQTRFDRLVATMALYKALGGPAELAAR